VFEVPKVPPPPKSPGELAGAAPNRPPPVLPEKLNADPAAAEAGAEAVPNPPNRLCPVDAGVLTSCRAPNAEGAPDPGAACAAAQLM